MKNFTKNTKCGINQQLIAPKILWIKKNDGTVEKNVVRPYEQNLDLFPFPYRNPLFVFKLKNVL